MARIKHLRIPVTDDEEAQIAANVREIAAANGMPMPSLAGIARAILLGANKRTKLAAGSIARRGRQAQTEAQ